MPRYEYKCGECKWHGLLWRSMDQRNDAFCPDCGAGMGRTYTKVGMPNTQSPVVDNRFFNNGRGEYDPGLGEAIHSRRQRRR
mgnify:FL=1